MQKQLTKHISIFVSSEWWGHQAFPGMILWGTTPAVSTGQRLQGPPETEVAAGHGRNGRNCRNGRNGRNGRKSISVFQGSRFSWITLASGFSLMFESVSWIWIGESEFELPSRMLDLHHKRHKGSGSHRKIRIRVSETLKNPEWLETFPAFFQLIRFRVARLLCYLPLVACVATCTLFTVVLGAWPPSGCTVPKNSGRKGRSKGSPKGIKR